MKKLVLNVRRRSRSNESISELLAAFNTRLKEVPTPWGLRSGASISVPHIGTGLSTTTSLRGKLGIGLSGELKFQFRGSGNHEEKAVTDDAVIIEFDSSKATWKELFEVGMPAYVLALGAYIARVERSEEAARKFDRWQEKCLSTGLDLDGHDGFFRFPAAGFMDRGLCLRACNGLAPADVANLLAGVVPMLALIADGIAFATVTDYPDSDQEIVAADRRIRERLRLPIWDD